MTTVLFDADGVLQRRRPGQVRWLLRQGGPRFLVDALRAEVDCLTGARAFSDALAEVAERHRVRVPLSRLGQAWLEIEVDHRRLALIDHWRASGLTCALATNQHDFRGRYLRDELRLDDHFDAAFYSFERGVAKPDPAFFTGILDDLEVEPASVLFVDDLPGNIRSARRVGIDARLHLWRLGPAHLRRIVESRLGAG